VDIINIVWKNIFASLWLYQACYDRSEISHKNPQRRHPKNALNIVEQVSKLLANFGGERTG
jgi:hypothetical protein